VAGALRRGPAITPSRSLVLFTAIGGDHLRRDQQHCKEIYAQAGLALYFAQVLEHGVVNAMFIARMPEREQVTRAEIDAFAAEQFETPLGAMLKAMRRYVTVPHDVDALLKEAPGKRNWLAHRFFREFAEHFMNAKGRDEMHAYLQDAQPVFQRSYKELEALTKRIGESTASPMRLSPSGWRRCRRI
jgi:hypothetical protein